MASSNTSDVNSSASLPDISCELFRCAITMNVPSVPTETPCGHIFERDALERWLIQTPRCPTCRLYTRFENCHVSVFLQRLLVNYSQRDTALDIQTMQSIVRSSTVHDVDNLEDVPERNQPIVDNRRDLMYRGLTGAQLLSHEPQLSTDIEDDPVPDLMDAPIVPQRVRFGDAVRGAISLVTTTRPTPPARLGLAPIPEEHHRISRITAQPLFVEPVDPHVRFRSVYITDSALVNPAASNLGTLRFNVTNANRSFAAVRQMFDTWVFIRRYVFHHRGNVVTAMLSAAEHGYFVYDLFYLSPNRFVIYTTRYRRDGLTHNLEEFQ